MLNFDFFLSPSMFFLLLSHDGVTEYHQSEEAVDLLVLQLHLLHQGVVVEHEVGVSQRVGGEINRVFMLQMEEIKSTGFCFSNKKKSFSTTTQTSSTANLVIKKDIFTVNLNRILDKRKTPSNQRNFKPLRKT